MEDVKIDRKFCRKLKPKLHPEVKAIRNIADNRETRILNRKIRLYYKLGYI